MAAEPTDGERTRAVVELARAYPDATPKQIDEALHEAGFDVYGCGNVDSTDPDEQPSVERWIESAKGWMEEL